MELHYLRDREGREVDFLVTSGRRPWFAVEVKLRRDPGRPVPSPLQGAACGFPAAYQVTLEGGRDFVQDGVRVVPASRFLAALV